MEQFTLKELVKRKLDETYVIIYAIKNEVNIKKAEIIEKTSLSESGMYILKVSLFVLLKWRKK